MGQREITRMEPEQRRRASGPTNSRSLHGLHVACTTQHCADRDVIVNSSVEWAQSWGIQWMRGSDHTRRTEDQVQHWAANSKLKKLFKAYSPPFWTIDSC